MSDFIRGVPCRAGRNHCVSVSESVVIFCNAYKADVIVFNMNLYQNFYNAYVKRHADKSKQTCQQEVNRLWKEAKLKFTDKNSLSDHINQEIEKLRNHTVQRKVQTMLSFICKVSKVQ